MNNTHFVIRLMDGQQNNGIVTKALGLLSGNTSGSVEKALGILAENIGRAAMDEAIKGVGTQTLTYIKKRTAKGIDRYGTPFQNLTAYTTRKKRAMLKKGTAGMPSGGVAPPRSNLYVTGKFYNSLHTRIRKSMSKGKAGVGIAVYSTDKGKKVRNIVNVREVFGLTQDEEAMVFRAFSKSFQSKLIIAKAKRTGNK